MSVSIANAVRRAPAAHWTDMPVFQVPGSRPPEPPRIRPCDFPLRLPIIQKEATPVPAAGISASDFHARRTSPLPTLDYGSRRQDAPPAGRWMTDA